VSDFSVVGVFDNKTYGVFDNYRDAREFYGNPSRREYSYNDEARDILCMHPCGCLYRAVFEKVRVMRGKSFTTREALEWRHTQWTRTIPCKRHDRSEEWAMYGHNDEALAASKNREK
jgi:hypothetical protein